MHVLILILMAGLIAHDGVGLARAPTHDDVTMVLLWLVPYAAVVALQGLLIGVLLLAVRRLPHRATPALRKYQWLVNVCHPLMVGYFLWFVYDGGGLLWLRGKMGDWVVLDELVAVTPVLAAITLEWFLYYPVDRALRREPAGSRLHYVTAQVRHQMLLILVPMVALLTLGQVLDRLVIHWPRWEAWAWVIHFGGFAAVLLLTPLAIRHLWDTEPLPRGPLRARLMNLCRQYRVPLRQLLVWHTYGGMVNGAAMGLIGPLRYVMLTDGLLQRLPEPQIEGVMAHELAHIKLHHIPRMMLCALAAAYALDVTAHLSLTALNHFSDGALWAADSATSLTVEAAVFVAVVLGWLLAFGWVSRRFERQADTFAVRHLSRQYPESPDPAQTISPSAVQTYNSGLMTVAGINRQPSTRRSWRHGSIQWRCDYLHSLIGTPVQRSPIDRQVRVICWGCGLLLAAALVYDYVLPSLLAARG